MQAYIYGEILSARFSTLGGGGGGGQDIGEIKT